MQLTSSTRALLAPVCALQPHPHPVHGKKNMKVCHSKALLLPSHRALFPAVCVRPAGGALPCRTCYIHPPTPSDYRPSRPNDSDRALCTVRTPSHTWPSTPAYTHTQSHTRTRTHTQSPAHHPCSYSISLMIAPPSLPPTLSHIQSRSHSPGPYSHSTWPCSWCGRQGWRTAPWACLQGVCVCVCVLSFFIQPATSK